MSDIASAEDTVSLSNAERYLTQNALDICDHEYEKRDRSRERSIAHQDKQNETRRELGELEFERGQRLRANKDADVSRLDKQIAKKKEKLRADQSKYDDTPTISMANFIDEFILTLRAPVKDRNTTDTPLKSKTPAEMLFHCGSMHAQARVKLQMVQRQPVSRDMIEQRIIADVAKLAKPIRLGGVKQVDAKLHRQGHIEWPMFNVVSGSSIVPIIDAPAILFSLFEKELSAKLIELALKDFDDKAALTNVQRTQAIAAANDEILDWQYRGEFWRRQLSKTGMDAPGFTSNVWAILDIVP